MIFSLSDLTVIALATLYLSYALTKTHGVFGLFTWLRLHVPLGGLTACIVCAAFWCALGCGLLWLTPLQPVVWVCAAAGLAVFAAHYVGMAQQ